MSGNLKLNEKSVLTYIRIIEHFHEAKTRHLDMMSQSLFEGSEHLNLLNSELKKNQEITINMTWHI